MFACRDRREGPRFSIDVAFTDRWGGVSSGEYATLDLTRHRVGAGEELAANRALVAAALGVDDLAVMRQVHGADVVLVDRVPEEPPVCDALVTTTPDVALCVRVGDCVPLVVADVVAPAVAVAHVGRPGVVATTVAAVLDALSRAGATELEAWIGPHVCGGCYEVPASMRADVASLEPAAFSCTTWGTPSIDIGAAVAAQLRRHGCTTINDVDRCTRESRDLFSYRRQGPASGRLGGIAVLRDRGGLQ